MAHPELAIDEPLGPAEIGEPALGRVERVEIRHGVNEGEAKPSPDLPVGEQGLGHSVPHDLAPAALHHEESAPTMAGSSPKK